jgi:hypothetical protein
VKSPHLYPAQHAAVFCVDETAALLPREEFTAVAQHLMIRTRRRPATCVAS